jgi:RNA polymerase sigma-70 factor (ECF subfamily)
MFARKTRERFEQLYEEHHRFVRNVIYNMTGEGPLEDLVQEAFLKIWQGLPAFGFRSSVKTWIYRVSINVAIDHFRKKRFVPEEFKEATVVTDPVPGQGTGEIKRVIQEGLRALDEEHRAVVVLHYFEELSIREVARTLEIPEGTVKSRLHYAKKRLGELLEKSGVFDGGVL